ncbi:hypothetical protein ACS5PK_08755 [Roseateles sp. DB2]|uniref:hypothetical protein n=1 Tax=Roseateles sp. DB2 TaxID=3453717 RepID=UPI003EEFF423
MSELIKRYTEGVSRAKPFEKNKAWVLNRMADRNAGRGPWGKQLADGRANHPRRGR